MSPEQEERIRKKEKDSIAEFAKEVGETQVELGRSLRDVLRHWLQYYDSPERERIIKNFLTSISLKVHKKILAAETKIIETYKSGIQELERKIAEGKN